MELRFEERDGILIVRTAGEELGAESAERARGDLLPQMTASPWVVLDLASLTFMDSSGLGVLVAAMKSVRGRGELRLTNVHARIRELFTLTGLGRVFQIDPDETTAIETLVETRRRSQAA